MKTFFASLLAVAFLQVSTAQLISSGAEYAATIKERQTTLGINIGLLNMQFGQTNGAIATNVAIGTSNITDLVAQLDSLVNAAVVEAKAAGRNIDACVSAVGVSVSGLNYTEIQSCRVIPQLGQARLRLNELAWIQGDLTRAVPKCTSLSPLDIVQIRVCVDGDLVRIDERISAGIASVQSILNDAVAASNQCVNDVRARWENQVATMQNNFSTCAAN